MHLGRFRRGAIPGEPTPPRPRYKMVLWAVAPLFLLVAASALTSWLSAVGEVWNVDAAACPQGTPAEPFCRIQDAICLAASGDTVQVAPGVYPESLRMKPGVVVVSEMGALQTTINAQGQPCTETNYCTKKTGNQCSVVIFSTGHDRTSVLDGFTLTGGAGTVQSSWVAGGGVFLASSATVTNNIITNNNLSGPSPQGLDLRGAGVYVSKGVPLVRNNTISANRAAPPAGTSGTWSLGYGGGVWLGFLSAPEVMSNVIQGNTAGDEATAFSLGSGGGMAVFTPGGTTSPVIDGNLIVDNSSDNQGGGISLLTRPGSAAECKVTNNVITGNDSSFGGGVYTYLTHATIMNNTITDNQGYRGGGIYQGHGDLTLPVKITNNVIESNLLRPFGNGGGIYNLDQSATFEPVIRNNDLWNNEMNNCGGELSDPTCIGVNGNFSANPLFVDRGAGDFHPDANSPAIDRADPNGAPAIDADGDPRGIDGDGAPNSPQPGDIDVGAFEFSPCLGVPEVCDGTDNDCDGAVDDGFPNADGDAMANCVDPDDDNDLVNDEADCAPQNATAFALPSEVSGLNLTGTAPEMTFALQSVGSGTVYEVISGLTGRLIPSGGINEAFCLPPSISSPAYYHDYRPDPPLGDAWFYLLRASNACGDGTLGSPERDAPGAGDVCQTGVLDQDNDGSPSDLDCADTDAVRSPINPEICDGVDNNCNTLVDDGNPGGGVFCGSDVGECQLGLTTCAGGTLQCQGAVGPSPETCDGLDNNCNGVADEGNPGGGASCGSDVGECQSGVATCAGGGLQCQGAVGPSPEACDGLDNDCNGVADEGQPDTDVDGRADCADCAPANPTAFAVPSEVLGLTVAAGLPTSIAWTEQSIGSGTLYDVVSGTISELGVLSFGNGACVQAAAASPVTDGHPAPPVGSVHYYMVRSRNACGTGSFGSPNRDTHPACP